MVARITLATATDREPDEADLPIINGTRVVNMIRSQQGQKRLGK